MGKVKIIKTSKEREQELRKFEEDEEFNKLNFEKCPHCKNEDNWRRKKSSPYTRNFESYYINSQECKKCGTQWEWYQQLYYSRGMTEKPGGFSNLTIEYKFKFITMCVIGFFILLFLSFITN